MKGNVIFDTKKDENALTPELISEAEQEGFSFSDLRTKNARSRMCATHSENTQRWCCTPATAVLIETISIRSQDFFELRSGVSQRSMEVLKRSRTFMSFSPIL